MEEKAIYSTATGINVVLGIDVSKWQGQMDWQKAKNAGVRFAIVKMSEYVIDERFIENWQNTQGLGIRRQPYHFFHPGRIDVDDQVTVTTGLLKKYGDPDPLNVFDGEGNLQQGKRILWLDCEVSDGRLSDYISSRIRAFIIQFKAKRPDLEVGIYTSPGWWNGNTLTASYWKLQPLWIANWGVTKPYMPRDWKHYALWQWSGGANGRGKEFGAGGALSIDLNWYNGTEAQFGGDDNPLPPPSSLTLEERVARLESACEAHGIL